MFLFLFLVNFIIIRPIRLILKDAPVLLPPLTGHLWLLSIRYTKEVRSIKSMYLDPFSLPTLVASLEHLLNHEKDDRKRIMLEDDLMVCWRLLTSSRVFRESQLRQVVIQKTKNQPNNSGLLSPIKQRPKSAHAGHRKRTTTSRFRKEQERQQLREKQVKENEKKYVVRQQRQRPATAGPIGRSSTPSSFPVSNYGTNKMGFSTQIILNPADDSDFSRKKNRTKRRKRRLRRPQSAVQRRHR